MAELNDIQLRIIVQGTGLDNLNRLNDTLAKATGNIAAASAAADTAKSKWSQFGDALSELERKFDAVFRAASHLQALGRDLTGMGEAGLGFLKESVEAWGEYEFALHRAAGALGIFDTASPIFRELQQAIDETAQEARLFPAEEIAKAVYYWGSATGQTVENHEDLEIVMKGLLPIMQTAAITESDYQAAIKGTYQIVQQYGLGLVRLADSHDVVAGRARYVGEEISTVAEITENLMMITQNTSLEYQDLIEAFRYTGSIAPALGVKYEELAVVLGRLGDLGIRGSMAGRALQQTFTKLLDPTVRASKALDEAYQNAFGLDKTFEQMTFPNGEFIGLTEYIDQLADVTEDMTDKERGNLVAIMTTQNELRTMIPLIEDQIAARKSGISVYDQEKYSLENASAQFEKTMHLLEISWKGTMGYLTNTIGPVIRAIGSEVAKLAQPFIEQFGMMLKQIRLFLDTNPELVQWGVRVIAIGSAIAIAAGAIFTAIGVLLAFGAGIAFVVKGMGTFMGIFTRAFPIIGAITAVVAALATNFGGLRDAAMNVIDALVKVWSSLEEGTSGTGLNVLSRLGNAVLPLLETMAKAVATALNGIASGLEWIAGNKQASQVLSEVLEIIMALLALGAASKIAGIAFSILTLGGNGAQATQGIKLLLDQMAKFGSLKTIRHPISAFKDLAAAVLIAGSTIKTTMAGILTSVRTTATGVSVSIKSVLIATGIGVLIVALTLLYEAWVNNWGDIQGKTQEAVDWVVARFTSFRDWILGVWDTITTSIGNAVTNIVNFFRDLPANIGTFFSELWTTISMWVTSIVTTIVEFPGKVWDEIVLVFTNIGTFLGEWWNSLGESTAERVGYLVGTIITLPIRIFRFFVEKFFEIWEWFVEWWENLTESIGNWVTSIVTAISDWFGKLPGIIGKWFGEVGANVSAWWNKLIADVSAWASSVVNTIINWISLLPGRVMEWLSSTWTTIYNWFAFTLIPNAGTWALGFVDKIIEFFRTLPGRAMDAINSIISKLQLFFRNLPDDIWSAILSVGSGIVSGIWEGISNSVGWLYDQVRGFVQGLINAALDALGIRSPSKVFANIGHQMVAGLAQGIDKNHSAVHALHEQIDTLVDDASRVKTMQMEALGGDFSFASDANKTLTIKHEVSSPDGTVDQSTQKQIREIFTAEEFVSALEHMATVG